MLLQQIMDKLDGELVRLRTLRSVVAGLARKPAGASSKKSRIELSVSEAVIAVPEEIVAALAVPAVKEVATTLDSGKSQARKRPRSLSSDITEPPNLALKGQQGRKRTEPTALGRAASVGPVVISAAALVREREARMAVKTTSRPQNMREAEPEIRPEAYARELAARWLSPSGKI